MEEVACVQRIDVLFAAGSWLSCSDRSVLPSQISPPHGPRATWRGWCWAVISTVLMTCYAGSELGVVRLARDVRAHSGFC